jgi:hypothetical protein
MKIIKFGTITFNEDNQLSFSDFALEGIDDPITAIKELLRMMVDFPGSIVFDNIDTGIGPSSGIFYNSHIPQGEYITLKIN